MQGWFEMTAAVFYTVKSPKVFGSVKTAGTKQSVLEQITIKRRANEST